MEHVRAELGPHARVIRAERVRTGGWAGFFQRERFELTIDVPAPEDLPAPPRERPRALVRAAALAAVPTARSGLDALLDAADAADGAGAVPAGAPAAPASPTTPAPAAAAPETPVALAPVADGADAPADAGPRVSTGGESFSSVLASVRAMTGDADGTYQASAGRPAAPALPPAPPAAAPAPVSPPAPPVPPAGFTPLVASALPSAVATKDGARRRGADRAALLELGVPARLLADVPDGAGPVPVSDLLVGVPSAPDVVREPGAVLVVVGEPEDAVVTAAQLVHRLRIDPTAVVHAGAVEPAAGHGRRISTPAAAARWRDRQREADQVGVVALGVGSGPADHAAAAELLAAFGADQVWAVVDARTKPRDCARWLAGVRGTGRMDALAIRGLFETTQPGTVLDLGVPVAWMDGIPATPVAWAAALSQHLGPDARWD